MHKLVKSTLIAMAVPAFAVTLPMTAQAEDVCEFNESRSGLVGCYHSQISSAEAFLNTVVKRGKWSDRSQGAVILDVRSTPEYKAGHPEGSYNVPSPFIYQYCNDVGDPGPQDDRQPDGACKSGGDRIAQTQEDFVRYVESIVPDKDTPIYTLCRTGVRSVGAANFLKEAGYTHVRNIWEGFVGIYLQAPNQGPNGEPGPLDVNHDTLLNDEDKNGWRYYQGLPYQTRLLPHLIYADRVDTYYLD